MHRTLRLCGCWFGRWARRGPATALLFVLTVCHPLLHPFEGGSLDAFMAWLTTYALMADD